MEKGENIVEIRNLDKSYKKTRVFSNFNLDIPKNKITLIIGRNGIGKSTLLNCIVDYVSYKGKIEIKGKFIYLPEIRSFYGDVYVNEFIELVKDMYEKEMSKDVHRYANMLGFDLTQKKMIKHLSKGNKSKLFFLALLMANYDLAIFDEPTDAYDIEAKRNFNRIIYDLKSKRKTIIISTHDFSILDGFKRENIVDLNETKNQGVNKV